MERRNPRRAASSAGSPLQPPELPPTKQKDLGKRLSAAGAQGEGTRLASDTAAPSSGASSSRAPREAARPAAKVEGRRKKEPAPKPAPAPAAASKGSKKTVAPKAQAAKGSDSQSSTARGRGRGRGGRGGAAKPAAPTKGAESKAAAAPAAPAAGAPRGAAAAAKRPSAAPASVHAAAHGAARKAARTDADRRAPPKAAASSRMPAIVRRADAEAGLAASDDIGVGAKAHVLFHEDICDVGIISLNKNGGVLGETNTSGTAMLFFVTEAEDEKVEFKLPDDNYATRISKGGEVFVPSAASYSLKNFSKKTVAKLVTLVPRAAPR
eukprot:TRINITY_DN5004_c0_g1_i1.p1 TRINITY_DN5004_c0_g1~~TRINITY_DN5004_c0_g1_i1.p1  ORF type:complete len:324 (-),score=57.58 TRINITY_DN5004_c0_g1_i1:346-1317(-)